MFITDGLYLSFCNCYVLSRDSLGYVCYGGIPSVVWTFSNGFSSSSSCRKLVLNRKNLLGVAIGAFMGRF